MVFHIKKILLLLLILSLNILIVNASDLEQLEQNLRAKNNLWYTQELHCDDLPQYIHQVEVAYGTAATKVTPNTEYVMLFNNGNTIQGTARSSDFLYLSEINGKQNITFNFSNPVDVNNDLCSNNRTKVFMTIKGDHPNPGIDVFGGGNESLYRDYEYGCFTTIYPAYTTWGKDVYTCGGVKDLYFKINPNANNNDLNITQKIENLKTVILSLNLSTKLNDSYIKKVENTIIAIQNEKYNSAFNKLRNLNNKIEKHYTKDKISLENKDELITLVDEILMNISEEIVHAFYLNIDNINELIINEKYNLATKKFNKLIDKINKRYDQEKISIENRDELLLTVNQSLSQIP